MVTSNGFVLLGIGTPVELAVHAQHIGQATSSSYSCWQCMPELSWQKASSPASDLTACHDRFPYLGLAARTIVLGGAVWVEACMVC